jgi:tripartite-type tricarboxylate transporter receptor subunit TctC
MRHACLMALAMVVANMSAWGQQFPTKAVRVVVPYPPGGSNDVLARPLAQKLSEVFGQPVIVDNRAGAGGAIGADFVAKAPPDGHTLLFNSMAFAAAASDPRLPFDTAKDFAAVASVGQSPSVLVVHPALPAKTVKNLIALARSRPGQINYSSSGIATTNHLAAELFRLKAGIDIVHVPYKGMAPAITDLIAGQVQMLITSFPSVGAQLQAGRVRAIAITSLTRSSFAPELLTVHESGVPGYDVTSRWGFFAPAATPKPIVDRLNAEIRKLLLTADMKERILKGGAEPFVTTPDEFRKLFLSEVAKWTALVRHAKIKLE